MFGSPAIYLKEEDTFSEGQQEISKPVAFGRQFTMDLALSVLGMPLVDTGNLPGQRLAHFEGVFHERTSLLEVKD
jgi:hypothetical protein